MKVAFGQVNPTVGALWAHNGELQEKIQRCLEEGVSLLLLPELVTTGYPPRDYLNSPQFIERNQAQLEFIASATLGTSLTIVCGFVAPNPSPNGRRLFNAAAVLSNGKHQQTYLKRLLPNYDVFDEQRYFEPGKAPLFFECEGKRFGLTICEDLWNHPTYLNRTYREQPIQDLKSNRVDYVINLAASPYHLGKPALREALFRDLAREIGAPILFCNQVGGNDELIFDGNSLVAHPHADVVVHAPAFKESLWIVDFDNLDNTMNEPPIHSDSHCLTEALRLGLRDYVHKCGARRVCLGLSGGIDSAVVAALAAKALGPESVLGVSLPTRYTSKQSNDDAAQLAELLGIEYRVFPVETMLHAYQNQLEACLKEPLQSLTLENLQPRIRMVVLMAMANQQNRLLLNTSNKSEIATGYATLYGDSAGALSVLGDVTKTQVYAIADYLRIPHSILTRPPTAELRENQSDTDSLPPYSTLDPILVEAVEHEKNAEQLIQEGFEPTAVKRFFSLYRRSEYKRHQLPPVLRVSKRAFGMGRRVPIAAHSDGF